MTYLEGGKEGLGDKIIELVNFGDNFDTITVGCLADKKI